ncbi:hypothetical protein Z517_09318 [Fonsecaea pedrosoi CBS 271.37]|uniref:Uncharacterized protein n=1 Tax=Fonsecaea pedrosoi CBS 271.37 TaxID=1442368 RepID=A0A0D2GWZ5_9EURO|nr:uncharacterized protein Z517_09318 [Fonsecaea pedrosoi CBS 271.37]KIW76874.1 hypothetical protein Z517_09318 [Fonsecaea pedrosoi CBS 271.37]
MSVDSHSFEQDACRTGLPLALFQKIWSPFAKILEQVKQAPPEQQPAKQDANVLNDEDLAKRWEYREQRFSEAMDRLRTSSGEAATSPTAPSDSSTATMLEHVDCPASLSWDPAPVEASVSLMPLTHGPRANETLVNEHHRECSDDPTPDLASDATFVRVAPGPVCGAIGFDLSEFLTSDAITDDGAVDVSG